MSQTIANDDAIMKVQPLFVLMFSLSIPGGSDTIQNIKKGLDRMPEARAEKHLSSLRLIESRLMGERFLQTGRIVRQTLGRMSLPSSEHSGLRPSYADIFLITHKTGAAVLELWIDAPVQTFNASLWIDWLRPDSTDGLMKTIRDGFPFLKNESNVFSFIAVRVLDGDNEIFIRSYSADLVRLLYLDVSPLPFKADFIDGELQRDFCLREGGSAFLSGLTALDLMAVKQEMPADESAFVGFHARCSLPLFLTTELLLLEQEIMKGYYEILTKALPASIDDLIGLKQRILDGLEEYYGVIAKATRFSAPLIEYGQSTLGINDLYESVIDRLEAVTFDITTRYQRNTGLMGFLLTILFGALEAGFMASGIATWYYADNLLAVMLWTVGTTVVTAAIIAAVLHKRIR